MIELQRKLKRDTTPLYQHLYSGVSVMSIEALSWKDPTASQVISDESKLVKELPGNLRKGFMVKNYMYIWSVTFVNTINNVYYLH